MIYETKQSYVQIEYLSPGFTQAYEGLKWRRKRRALKNNFTDRKYFIRRYQRNGWMISVNFGLHNEGPNTLVMGGLG